MKRRGLSIVFFLVLVWLSSTCTVFGASFVTEQYDVELTLARNNSWLVTETIEMNYTAPGHGIYRYLPYEGTYYYAFEGIEKEKPYQLEISDIEVLGRTFEVTDENGCKVIRIGDPDITIQGPASYTLQYKVTAYDDRISEFDQLYWNLLPVDWNTPIPQARFTVHLPGEASASQIEFLTGAYGSTVTDGIDWDVSGNVIVGTLNSELELGGTASIRVLFPEGYFAGERSNDWLLSVILLLLFLAPLTAGLLWYFFGRDPKIVKTVEFEPPKGIDPSMTGYLIDGFIDHKDMVAKIIGFANEGYLSIHEDGLGVFTLIRDHELPDDAPAYQKTLFHALFGNKDEVALKKLPNNFPIQMAKAKQQLRSEFDKSKEDRVFTQGSLLARFAALLLMIIPLFAVLCLGTIYSYHPFSAAIAGIFLAAGAALCYAGFIVLYDKRDVTSKGRRISLTLILAVATGLFLLGVFLYSALYLGMTLLGLLAIVASSIVCIYAALMRRRPKKSAELLGKLLGYKEFIRTAEQDRIRRFVLEDPTYFYRVLPYAYVFGLTNRWVEKFEAQAVPPPSWYSGNSFGSSFNTLLFASSFHSFTNAMQHSFLVPDHAGSQGSGGGGFSSGGGFSGGGMGGGGGGGW